MQVVAHSEQLAHGVIFRMARQTIKWYLQVQSITIYRQVSTGKGKIVKIILSCGYADVQLDWVDILSDQRCRCACLGVLI